ncbi:hypothetical protein [Streptomyces sp. NPDC127197]|uniref:hypothetical protein n=1 Tax=Streptomyces sp. NPDC127197 TaxID=3345388 RepID=UPI00363179A7
MTNGPGLVGTLSPLEQALIDHVNRGEELDLDRDVAIDEAVMRAWDDSRAIRAEVVRDIVRGRGSCDPDPHGIRLRGARIVGRVDLQNLTSSVPLSLRECFLAGGLDARNATLESLSLTGCLIEHASQPPLDGAGMTAAGLSLTTSIVLGEGDGGAVNLWYARLGALVCSGATVRNTSGPALSAEGLQVERSVVLQDGFEAVGSGQFGAVRLTMAHIGELWCDGATVRNDTGPAVFADGMEVSRYAALRNGFTAIGKGEFGAVKIPICHFGTLDLQDAVIQNEVGPALNANSTHVEQIASLYGFEAAGSAQAGAILLNGAHLGKLNCAGATVRNDIGPAVEARGLHVDRDVLFTGGFEAVSDGNGVTINLSNARINGQLVYEPTHIEHRTDSRSRLNLEGLTYSALPGGIPWQDWLVLIQQGTPMYAAQPYQQLAAGLRAAGHDGEVRRVLMAQRRDQILRRALTGRAERTWARLTGFFLGYGYQPWRALVALAAVMIISVLVSVTAGAHGGLTRTDLDGQGASGCSVVEQVGFGLDIGLPLIKTGAGSRCGVTDQAIGESLTIASWGLQASAWAFATLFIAGFTGAVRKQP